MCLGFLLPIFAKFEPRIQASAAADLEPLTVIVDTDINKLDGSLKMDATNGLGHTPFDEERGEAMEGYSVTPVSNANNEIYSRTYSVSPFNISRSISIFMWIYFPDDPMENFYDLTISFSNNLGEKIIWSLPYDRLYDDLMTPMSLTYNYYGWKQLELVYTDAEKSFTDLDTTEKTLNIMEISYIRSENDRRPTYTTSGTLSFYNVFTHSKIGEETNIHAAKDYAYYAFNPSFTSAFDSLYVGASYKLTSKADIFSYIYVGKNNLTLTGVQSNMFDLSITCKYYNDETNFFFGDTIPFDNVGVYTLTFKLVEQVRADRQREIFNARYDIEITKYTFGMFSSSTYDVEKDSSIKLRFDVSGDFIAETAFSFSIDDTKTAKIESFEFDSTTNSYYIVVTGLKKGKTTLKISAKGYGGNSFTPIEFVESTSIVVNYNGLSPWLLTLLYCILGFYAVAFIIFVSISFVNSRRNIVK